MKWLSLVIIVLSAAAMCTVFGFSLFSVIMGVIGGLIASFGIAAYLQSVKRDFPSDYYENENVKHGSNYTSW